MPVTRSSASSRSEPVTTRVLRPVVAHSPPPTRRTTPAASAPAPTVADVGTPDMKIKVAARRGVRPSGTTPVAPTAATTRTEPTASAFFVPAPELNRSGGPPPALAAHLAATGRPHAILTVAPPPPPALAAHIAAAAHQQVQNRDPQEAARADLLATAARAASLQPASATAQPTQTVRPPAEAPTTQEAPSASKNKKKSSKGSLSRKQIEISKAKEEYARLQVKLAAAKIAVLEAEVEQASSSSTSTIEDEAPARVEQWLTESHRILEKEKKESEVPEINFAHPQATGTLIEEKKIEVKSDIAELAAAIAKAATQASTRPHLSRHFSELPFFNGAHQDWLSFKAAYTDTASYFTDVENTARLRRNLKGKAHEAVANLLIHHTRPSEIIRALEARFGRPDTIASAELEHLRALQRPNDTPRDICVFASKVANVVAALKALNKVYYLYNPELTKITTDKLPSTLRHRWFDFAALQPAEDPDLLKLSRFLDKEAELCSPFAQPENIPTAASYTRNNNQQQPKPHQRTHATQERTAYKCPACNTAGHGAHTCAKFAELDVDGRWDIAKKGRLCFRCLRYRTRIHSCKPVQCDTDGCTYTHHKLLHSKRTTEKIEKNSQNETEAVASTWAKRGPENLKAFLKIAPITISGPAGEVQTWALLDDGSTVTLIDSALAEQVGAKGPVEPLNISAIADTKLSSAKSRRVTLTIQGKNSKRHNITMRTIGALNLSPQYVTSTDIKACEHLRDLQNQLSGTSAEPRVLIGQDNWHLLVAEQMKTGRRDQPVASLTALGWVLHGACTRSLGQRVHFMKIQDSSMDEQLRHYFALENLLINPKTPANDPEKRALQILENQTKQREDGHYETALLWKTDDFKMPENYQAAVNRLQSVERKLRKDQKLAEKYTEQMSALLSKGYAERAPIEKSPDKTWYLPHFGVTNPMKPEKLRVVHDAAAKTCGKSLNDYLLTGPDLLQSLPGVLMRFRQHEIAVTADIAEMFMQVKIKQEDRDTLRYLWRESEKDEPQEYRMTSLIFGATCSPSIAIYVKNKNAEKFQKEAPEAVSAIINNHYVDDYLASYSSEKEAIEIAQQVSKIHKNANYELRKWTSNSPNVLQALQGTENSPSTVTIGGAASSERVLGINWDPNTDKLSFNLAMARISKETLQSTAPTKREALKIVMSLYDPLGLASPVTSRAKQLLQELWRKGTDWDEKIAPEIAEHWRSWTERLRELRDVAIPRTYACYAVATELQLHVFVDASELAYATALYWRARSPEGVITTTLITAKAKVAPLKLTSIPRLELQAAVLGSRMAAAVQREHSRKPDKRYFWTDSRTVLAWLRAGARTFRPFVAHRIAAIEENSELKEWHWVPTKNNVADDATRDVPSDFNENHRWFVGPEFLRQDTSTWPETTEEKIELTGEEKINKISEITRPKLSESLPEITRFSDWQRLRYTTARVLQFIQQCKLKISEKVHYKRTKKNSEKDATWRKIPEKIKKIAVRKQPLQVENKYLPVTAELLKQAEKLLMRASQEEAFPEEIEKLKNNKKIDKESRLYETSVCYENSEIRLRGRINAAREITPEKKNPLVIAADHPTVKLWIQHVHRSLNHAGVEATVNECRQEHWVLRLRPVTRTIIRKCLHCFLKRAAPPKPRTGDLPQCRLAHHQRPFAYTGVDYFGPLNITVGRTRQKRYVALFTCLTSRAVHLEIAASLTTDSAIMALRRMIARRGCPSEIWSDNGTNLRGADRELRAAIDAATAEEATKRTISWRYIPPGAPFMGGAWERLVRSVKDALTSTLTERSPSEEVLTTLLAEAEYSVNSRPLTHVSVSADDDEALTPNHFLIGGSGRVPLPGTFHEADEVGRHHWRAAQRLADVFWKRWLTAYLPELQHRREPHGRGHSVKTGDLVILADQNMPRNVWARGRVTQVYPGPDGVVRTVDIKTQAGTLRRPVKKLVILPEDVVPPST